MQLLKGSLFIIACAAFLGGCNGGDAPIDANDSIESQLKAAGVDKNKPMEKSPSSTKVDSKTPGNNDKSATPANAGAAGTKEGGGK